MDKDEIRKKVQDPESERWLLWFGYILDETEEKREIEYFGRFVKTKKEIIGILKSMVDNTAPYRIIIQDTKPFKVNPEDFQTELKDFFKLGAPE